jgi:hypothetical protein
MRRDFLLTPQRSAAAARFDDHVAVRQPGLDANDAAIGVATAPAFVTAHVVFAHNDAVAITTLADFDLRRSRKASQRNGSNRSTQNKSSHSNLLRSLWTGETPEGPNGSNVSSNVQRAQ